jgi:hypothetical protein
MLHLRYLNNARSIYLQQINEKGGDYHFYIQDEFKPLYGSFNSEQVQHKWSEIMPKR